MSTPVNIFKESWYYLGMRYPRVADWFNRAFIDYQAKVNRRISITEFGDYLHLSQPTISAYMNGTRKPSFDKAKEICTSLGDVALMEILGYSLSELGPLPYSPLPPTPTPEATPTPTFARWTTADAVAAIQAAGLEFVDPHPMTKDDYGMAPMSAAEAVRFLLPSVCSDCGGRLYSFSSQADLELMKNYYEELGRQSALFFSWVFVKDNLLLQINGDLPEGQALKYKVVMDGLQ